MRNEPTKLVAWRAPESIQQRIARLAERENRSFSNMLEVLVREAFAERNKHVNG